MILLWGEFDDPPFASVVKELRRMERPVLVVTGEILEQAEFHLSPRSWLEGHLHLGGTVMPLTELTAAYLRPNESPPATAATAHCMEALLTWAETAPARIVNRPAAMAANNSKPYQAHLIRAAGFATPETLLTTDPAAVRDFQQRHGQLVYKSISGVRSIVSRLSPDHESSLEDVAHCPTMFQRYIDGVDYRVHVVGSALFPCRVLSPADDYRYPQNQQERPTIEAIDIDPEVGARIQNMVRSMNLLVAGVDLRRTADGQWYCFEVNPSPAFTFFAQNTGQPIAAAIANLLASPGA